jgi:phosphatidate phosphatase APP1
MLQSKAMKWAKKINPASKLKLWIKQKLGWLGVPVIIPYSGYGNHEKAFFIGCISEDKGLAKPEPFHSKWQNLIAMAKRFTSDEIPGVRVKATLLNLENVSITDKYGIFRFEFDFKNKNITFPKEPWVEIKLELLDQVSDHQQKTEANGKILLLKPKDSSYGVISDIDDTILVSHSTNLIQKLRLMLFKNAFTRLPFEGVAGFYRALHKGYQGNCHNPIFYVSSSQWNLFDLLSDFCAIRRIPPGVMLLQELKPFKPRKLISKKAAIEKHAHKLDKIRGIMSTYDHLNFVLIGDSGQKDAEIYRQVAKEFPGRILAIYIRDIRKSRVKKILVIGTELNSQGIEMLLIEDTVYAAQHAIEIGLINASSLSDVVYEKEHDHLAALEI